MWKKLTLGVAGLLVLAAVILGPGNLWSALRGLREVARDTLDREKSDVHSAAEIRVGLKDLDDKILRFSEKLGEIVDRAATTRRRVQALEQDLAKERAALERSKAVLDRKQESYTIGGRRYSRQEVNADALARLNCCDHLNKQLGFERQVVKQLDGSITEARANLGKAHLIRQQKAASLVALEARLENAGLLAQVNDLTRELRTTPLGPQTELAQKMEAFERRVAAAERRANTLGAGNADGAVINWDAGPDGVPDARSAIARFLANGDGEASNK